MILHTEPPEQVISLEKVQEVLSGSPDKPLAIKCRACRTLLCYREFKKSLKVCSACDYHFPLTAYERIHLLVDPGSFVEIDAHLTSANLLLFKGSTQGYLQQLTEERQRTGLNEAVVSGYASIENKPLALAVMDSHFLEGSMGEVVGEKITRTMELALKQHVPLVIVSASLGIRAQEGIISLLQMAKTSMVLTKLRSCRLPYISILTDPTVGTVAASFALLGDVLLAEPGSTICLSHAHPIEPWMHGKPPKGIITAECLFQHGFLDAIVHRHALRNNLARLMHLYKTQEKAAR